MGGEVGSVRLVIRVLAFLGTAIIAYGLSVFLYGVANQISAAPSGPLWDPSFRTSLRFILIILGFIALVFPAFRTESPRPQRAQAVFAAAFFAVYVFFKLTKVVDPDVPLHLAAGVILPFWDHFVHTVSR